MHVNGILAAEAVLSSIITCSVVVCTISKCGNGKSVKRQVVFSIDSLQAALKALATC